MKAFWGKKLSSLYLMHCQYPMGVFIFIIFNLMRYWASAAITNALWKLKLKPNRGTYISKTQ